MQNNTENIEKILDINAHHNDIDLIENVMDDKDINFKVLKRKHPNQLNPDYEKCQNYYLAAKIMPQSIIHCLSFNNSYVVYVQNKILTIYSVQQNIYLTFNIRKWMRTKIQLLRIASDSKFIYIFTEYLLVIFGFAKNMIKFQKRIQIRNAIQFKLISPQLIMTDSLKSKTMWDICADLKFISLKTKKIIFKINHKVSLKHHILEYDQLNNCIVYEEKCQWFVNFTNIHNREILIQVSLIYDSNIYLSNLILLKNTCNLILMYQNFMTVNKLNYKNRKIDFIKKLQTDFSQIHYENNQLALLCETSYLIFDENYNVKKRFKVNFKDHYPYNNYQALEFNQSQPSFLLYGDLTCLYILKEQPQKNIKAEYYLEEIDYYLIQNVGYSLTQTQQTISPNELYLAISHQNQIIVYYVKQQLEILKTFRDYIKQIAFSTDSTYLYIKFNDSIICMNLLKNLKSKRIQMKNTNKIISQQNFIIIKKKSGQFNIVMKNSKKQIIKVTLILQEFYQIYYIDSNQDIILSNCHQLFLYSLLDRKTIIIQQIENQLSKIIPNTQMILILGKQYQLQLWKIDYEQKQFILLKNLQQDIKEIFSDQIEIFVQLYGQILVLNNIKIESNNKDNFVLSQNYVFMRENITSVNKYVLIIVSLRKINEIIE